MEVHLLELYQLSAVAFYRQGSALGLVILPVPQGKYQGKSAKPQA